MGLKGVASFNQAAAAITGGTIDGATIGASTPAAITGTTITANTAFAVDDATSARVTAQNLGTPYVIAKWGVPVILASSGSMGDNGAVTGMTALPATYSGGAWLYLPAGAIAAGVPAAAGFYWFIGSSTTAGTVYNSTFDGLSVPALGTATAFSTTGPGAFTGVATGEIVAATVTVPAGAMGANGSVYGDFNLQNNTAAGNKSFIIEFSGASGTVFMNATASTASASRGWFNITNSGVTNVQEGSGQATTSSATWLGTHNVYAAVDTTAATTIAFSLTKATATNHATWQSGRVYVVYGA